MSMAHGTTVGSSVPRTLALTFGANHLYLVGRQQAPLWVRKRGPWRRSVKIRWHRLDRLPGHWWLAQSGRTLVILGQGSRPALILHRTEAPSSKTWTGFIPPGRQSIAVTLPDACGYEAQPVGEGRYRGPSVH